MTLILDLAPSVEAHLKTEAHRRDMSVSEFVAMLLSRCEEPEGAAHSDPPQARQSPAEENVRRMREDQVANRELVVEIVTAKNNLRAELDRQERRVAEMEAKAAEALRSGNRQLAMKLFKARVVYEQVLPRMQAHFATAEAAAERARRLVGQEEDRILVQTAWALAIKSSTKLAEFLQRVDALTEPLQEPSVSWQEEEWEQRFEEWARAKMATENPTPPKPGPEGGIAPEDEKPS